METAKMQKPGCPPPPGMDTRKGKGKLMCIKVRMLDDTVGVFHLGHKALGQALFDEVCRHLNLLESDYFGLEFVDSYGNQCWLDKEKSILRQIMAAQSDARFFFIVKFYTPNPAELEEEYTRYMFALQIRRDLARGEFVCNENTAAMLVSFVVQSECGDFSPLDYPDHTYLSATQFVPNQSAEFQHKVMEQHRKLVGMSPAEADFNLLETARRCDFYGVRLHAARDLEGIEVALSVAHMGIKVFHQLNCVTTFSWAKVRKLSFKRKRLMIKIHADSAQYKETVEFQFENRDDCKTFWKKCVEHHSFFRCQEPAELRRDSSRHLFHRGSHFHYQGRTQKQLIDYVREHRKRREPFERPLRRSGAPGTLQSTVGGAAAIGHRGGAMFVSDRMAAEFRLDNGTTTSTRKGEQQRRVNFPSISTAPGHETAMAGQQNGGGGRDRDAHFGLGPAAGSRTTTMSMANGGGKKARPKSAMLPDNNNSSSSNGGIGVAAARHGQQRRAAAPGHPAMGADPMQSSCYGAILPTGPPAPNGGGGITEQQQQQQQFLQEQQNAFALFHQQMDPMSMSLPNVLAPSALQTDSAACCHQFCLPQKSLSGENFHGLEQHRRETDNQSEGSYRLLAAGDPYLASGGAGGGYLLNSSQSDVGSVSTAPPVMDQRLLYQTTFTTKRVGNVIVKRVQPTVAAMPTGSTIRRSQQQLQQQQSATTATNQRGQQQQQQQQNAGDGSPTSFADQQAPPIPSSSSSSMAPTCLDAGCADAASSASVAAAPPSSACSSTCCSNYSIASSSAAASTARSGGGGGRLRFAPSSGGGGAFAAARLRHEIPVAIDGPPPTKSVAGSLPGSASSTPTPIIRPVLIPSPPNNSSNQQQQLHPSSASTSAQSTPSATHFQLQQQNGGRAPPLVLKKLGGGGDGTKIVPITKVNPAAVVRMDGTKQQQNVDDAATTIKNIGSNEQILVGDKQKPVANAGGPVPGRVVRRQDLVITPNGIDLKPQEQKQTVKEQQQQQKAGTAAEIHVNNNNGKPKVPPKPADWFAPDLKIIPKTVEGESESNEQPEPDRALLDPLESILKDVQALNQVLGDLPGATASNAVQQPRPFPTAIAIQSEERPDLRTVHLFNERRSGDGTVGQTDDDGTGAVPYTLTVRNLNAAQRVGGGGDPDEQQTNASSTGEPSNNNNNNNTNVLFSNNRKIQAICEHASRHGKSSIELVNRRRLPSTDSYSSQDHSISPTSPDSGNVLEYMLRKRSQSSDRAMSGQQQQQKRASAERERRLTRPVELANTSAKRAEGRNEQFEAMNKTDFEAKSGAEHRAEMAKVEEGKATAEVARPAEADQNSHKMAIEEEAKRLLETDF